MSENLDANTAAATIRDLLLSTAEATEKASAFMEDASLSEETLAEASLMRSGAEMIDRLRALLADTERERDAQMQSKLDAQVTLKAVTDALDLRFADLGDGWREAAPKVLARIETIVDEGERGFRERDETRERAERAEQQLAEAQRQAHAILSLTIAAEGGRRFAGRGDFAKCLAFLAELSGDEQWSFLRAALAAGETER